MANNTDIAIQDAQRGNAQKCHHARLRHVGPATQASFTDQKSTTPSTGALQGASTVVSLNQPANFSYSQTLPSGMQYSVSFYASKSTTNSSFAT